MSGDWALVISYFVLFIGAGFLLRAAAGESAKQLVRVRNKIKNEKNKH